MKIRLEKPAVNMSKLTGGKNEKTRPGMGGGGGGFLHEKFWLDFQGTMDQNKLIHKSNNSK